MCLYPKLILNKKYKPNKKNGGNVPEIKDPRTGWVPVGCKKCIECKQKKGAEWQVRLLEEIRNDNTGKFVTLTFSNQSIKNLYYDIPPNVKDGYELDNAIATLAVRRFLERWRKEHGKSVKHWLITEIGQPENKNGHRGTENLHLHGIIFTNNAEEIQKHWQYGFVYIGKYVNEQTINYCTKYATKMDFAHKEYSAKILTSPGIGYNYINRSDANKNKYKSGKTEETYITRQGYKLGLPIYYRNKLYSEEEREKLWIEKLDKEERYILGTKISTKNGPEEYYAALKAAREQNNTLGYGNDETDWNRKEYEENRRKINLQKRLTDNKDDDIFTT